jgi:hypothetical protein
VAWAWPLNENELQVCEKSLVCGSKILVGYYFSDRVLCCCYLFFHHHSSMALPMLEVYGECTGNFQNRERMQLQKAARIRYGRFFYRFPNGESAADVYDRITGKFWFLLSHNGALWQHS